MMAACRAAELGAKVTLLEQNEKLGKKIYITGKGRCNVTNLCDQETFRKNVVKNPRFLFSALSAFDSSDMVEWLHDHGCQTITERGNRVFPASQKASDITKTFEKELRRLRVEIRLYSTVSDIQIRNRTVTGVVLQTGEILPADSVILCTGGCSYPSTGSSGDGWKLLSDCGHQLFPPLPSLVGLVSRAEWVKTLQGLTLKNVKLTLRQEKKKLFSDMGEMLFTHFGVSGPLVLSASAYMTELDPAEVSLILNLKPALSFQQLENRILHEISESPKKQIASLLSSLLPGRLAGVMGTLCQLDSGKMLCMLSKEERETLISHLLSLPIPISGLCSLQEAIVTRGGADVKEFNASTMESKKISGLFVAGELLDMDALTGGFNLQIAFSTGYVAGQAAAKNHLEVQP